MKILVSRVISNDYAELSLGVPENSQHFLIIDDYPHCPREVEVSEEFAKAFIKEFGELK